MRAVLLVASLGLAGPALAQEPGSGEPRREIRQALDALPDSTTPGMELIKNWQVVGDALEGQDVKAILTGEGWDEKTVGEAISAQKYDLYQTIVGPGVKTYMAVPVVEGGDPVQFGSEWVSDKAMIEPQQASWLTTDPEELRKQILIKLAAAIEALCMMEARPTTIRAGASAFGVISVEGTWEAAEVCGP